MNKVRNFFAAILSASCISNSSVSATTSIGDIIKEASKDANKIVNIDDPILRLIATCALNLQDFATNEEYVSLVCKYKTSKSCDDSVQNDYEYSERDEFDNCNDVKEYSSIFSSSSCNDLKCESKHLLPIVPSDSNYLNHCPGYSQFFASLSTDNLKEIVNETAKKTGSKSFKKLLLELQLNYVLNQREKHLNTLILGACVYCGARNLGANAYIVHTNLGDDPNEFDPNNSETTVIIRYKLKNLYKYALIKFTSNKYVCISFGNSLRYVRFKKGSKLYFKEKISRLGLEKDYDLQKDMSFHTLVGFINENSKKKLNKYF